MHSHTKGISDAIRTRNTDNEISTKYIEIKSRQASKSYCKGNWDKYIISAIQSKKARTETVDQVLFSEQQQEEVLLPA